MTPAERRANRKKGLPKIDRGTPEFEAIHSAIMNGSLELDEQTPVQWYEKFPEVEAKYTLKAVQNCYSTCRGEKRGSVAESGKWCHVATLCRVDAFVTYAD